MNYLVILLISTLGLKLITNIDYLKYIYFFMNTIIINITYNSLYIFSVCQIKTNKLNKIISNMITTKENTFFYLVNNGDIIKKINKINSQDIIEKDIWLLLCDKPSKNNCTNKVYYEKLPKTIDYKLSEISFIMIELEYKNQTHTIELKNSNYNYYIVNNCLNENFFKYYVKNILKLKIDKVFDYNVNIVDNNINCIKLLSTQCLVFNKNNYEIKNKNI